MDVEVTTLVSTVSTEVVRAGERGALPPPLRAVTKVLAAAMVAVVVAGGVKLEEEDKDTRAFATWEARPVERP